MHVDLDCFFCSVATRNRPDLQHTPVAVVSGQGLTSEVCSANYAAREFGLRANMFLSEARQRCPSLTVIPTSADLFDRYTYLPTVLIQPGRFGAIL